VKALDRKQLKCPVTNKSAFVDEKRALAVVSKLRQVPDWVDRHGGVAKAVYKCPHCGWWHLTKRPNNRIQQNSTEMEAK